MANLIFTDKPGVMIKMPLDSEALPGILEVKTDENGTFSTGSVIIQNVRTQNQSNHQLQLSLGKASYLYTFGDRPGAIKISGLCFSQESCDDTGSSRGVTGLDEIFKYYEKNKLSNFESGQENPLIKISLANKIFQGLLLSITTSTNDPSRLITNFTLNLQTVPRASKDNT